MKIIATMAAFAGALALVACSAAEDPSTSEAARVQKTSEDGRSVAASEATRARTGIASWSIERHAGTAEVVGLDENSERKVALAFEDVEGGGARIRSTFPTAGVRVVAPNAAIVEDSLPAAAADALVAVGSDLEEAGARVPAADGVTPLGTPPGGGATCVGVQTKCYGVVQYCHYVDWNGAQCASGEWRCGWCFGLWF